MNYDVRIESIAEPRPLAVVRRTARQQELSRVVPEACGIVWSAIKAQGTKGAGRHVALYLDCQINLEVGVEVETPFPGHGEVVGSALPTGTAVTTTHFGPYGGLGAAHLAIHDWCKNNGYALAGPSWEVYGHWIDEWNREPSKIRTDVFYLVKADGKPAD
ncbi:MAG TPA: GyrI-like domain-containing protein [Planctomycetia bacterium]|nr:GyrI-like domain-containing protein [Planctomycetia bacterium]